MTVDTNRCKRCLRTRPAICDDWVADARGVWLPSARCVRLPSRSRGRRLYALHTVSGGTRTLKLFRAMAPKTIASANFATPAACRSYRLRRRRVVGKGLDEFAGPDS